jgi:predicted transposase/invertase (TIGR01784 family)
MKIPLVKIIDYRLDEKKRNELEVSASAMALVVKAQLKSQEINKDETESRFDAKKELIRECYKRGYGREQIRTLLKFIDWIIRLPDGLEEKICEEIIHIEEEHKMSYIPTWERKAEQKGREAGLKEGTRSRNIEIARKLLRKGIALEIISETTGLSQAEIESLEVKQ